MDKLHIEIHRNIDIPASGSAVIIFNKPYTEIPMVLFVVNQENSGLGNSELDKIHTLYICKTTLTTVMIDDSNGIQKAPFNVLVIGY